MALVILVVLRCFLKVLGVVPKFREHHSLHIKLAFVTAFLPVPLYLQSRSMPKSVSFALFISAFFREAAKECRRRKKEYVKCLESRVAMLEVQNKKLIEELETFKDICSSKAD